MFLLASRKEFAMKRFCSGIFVVLLFSTFASSQANQSESKARHTPVVEDLVTLLEARPPVREALESAIRNAGLAGLENTEALLDQSRRSRHGGPDPAGDRSQGPQTLLHHQSGVGGFFCLQIRE
jgi:hypothetical protein